MTTVESRVVDPVTNRAAVNDVDVSETEMVDAVLKHEEETKILVDEEIDSCEGVDLEEHMLTVALVKSVVDTGSSGPESPRYGLRKRRRPGDVGDADDADSSAKKPAHVPSPLGGPTATIQNGLFSIVAPADVFKTVATVQPRQPVKPPGDETTVPKLKQEHIPGSASTTAPSLNGEARIVAQEPKPIQQGPRTIHQPLAHSISPKVVGSQVKSQPPLRPLAHPGPRRPNPSTVTQSENQGSSSTTKKIPSPRKKVVRPSKTKSAKISTQIHRADPTAGLLPTSGAVPNPLLQSTPPPLPHPFQAAQGAASETAPDQTHASVPCPLPAAVPCPLQRETTVPPVEKRVTIVEPPALTARNRIFSVDLDPSTFDFSDMAGDPTDIVKTDPDLAEISGASPPPDDLALFKRDRAFSFEFFNFGGEVGEDLLPAPPANTSAFHEPMVFDEPIGRRPRGDSIIFDPVSFQDGGIHEKNAIMKVNAAKEMDTTSPCLLADSRLAAPPLQVRPHPPKPFPVPSRALSAMPPPPHPEPTPSSAILNAENGQLATLPSGLTIGNAHGNTPATFQMELLNKDGRIGIYLPEARRARIARFHAKRKMRIWRKRIKYDCRKKLADSRPRIKGRFVKRSDMDD